MNELLAQVRLDQRERWGKGERVLAESYLERHPELSADADTALDLIYSEILLRRELGETPRAEEYTARFPRHAESLRAQLELEELLWAIGPPGEFSVPTVPHGPPETEGDGPSGRPAATTAEFPIIPGYEILGRLGVGGLGVVYQARQLNLDRVVALKMLRHEGAEEADDLARLQHEARATTKLNHAHIVQVYEFGKHNGRPYFTMEHIGGGSLRERLAAGPLAPAEAVRLLEKLARALDAVHREKIVHRDLKPGNVLLTAEGEPKVADFGLAKYLGGEASLHPSGAVVGTPCYMAPEQARGKGKEVGPATDVWALGAILYELLTGQLPFRGTTDMETFLLLLGTEPVRVRRLQPTVPRDLETICSKCLEKEPARRYASALELAEDLRFFQAGEPIKARPRRWYERLGRWVRRRPAIVAGAALLLLAAAAAPFALERPESRPPPAREEPPTPEQARRAAEATLAAGKPYVLKGDEPLPGPLRWVFGGTAPPQPEPGERCFSVETVSTGLLELMADPGRARYRFSAWVRHDGASGASVVGLYFGYRERRGNLGLRGLGYYTLTFAERGNAAWKGEDKAGRALSRVVLRGEILRERSGRTPVPFDVHLPAGELLFPQAPLGQLGPWRQLLVTVTPDGVEATCRTRPGQVERLGRVTAAQIQKNFLSVRVFDPETKVIPAEFLPRGGLGLYVRAGKALFRDVVVETFFEGQ